VTGEVTESREGRLRSRGRGGYGVEGGEVTESREGRLLSRGREVTEFTDSTRSNGANGETRRSAGP
jgi:hypothetical protein